MKEENKKIKVTLIKRMFSRGVRGPRKTTVRVESIVKMILIERVIFFMVWGYLHWKSPTWYGYNWWSVWILFAVDTVVYFVILYYYLRHRGIDEK